MSKTKTKASLASFRAEHDNSVRVPALIAAALVSLLAEGPEAWEYEADFIRRCGPGVGAVYLARYREQFKDHYVEISGAGYSSRTPKKVWFGSVKTAAKARESLKV